MHEVWLFIIAIVALGIGGDIVKKYMDRREAGSAGEMDDLLGELEELTDRVRVLEEIVTDDRHRLRQEIAEL